MKKFTSALPLLTASCLTLAAPNVNATTIQDRDEYRASTDIYLKNYLDENHLDCSLNDCQLLGHTTASGRFQFNLEYDGINPDSAIEQFNDSQLGSGLNWMDPEYYNFSFSKDGDDEVYTYGVTAPAPVFAYWTITGWWHTPFSGGWDDLDGDGDLSDGDYLSLSGYQPFPSGWFTTTMVSTEVLGYTYRDDGSNTWLAVNIASVPEPGSLALLGLGLAGLGFSRRKKS